MLEEINISPMRIEFTRNVHFTRLLKTAGRQREFNFRKMGGTPELLFHVDVSDDRGNRIMFRMQKAEKGHWKIITPVPQWIIDIENNLHNLIEKGLEEEVVE